MGILRPLLITLFAVCCAEAQAADACFGRTPLEAAEAFYREHKDFSLKDPKKLQGHVTMSFYEALAFEYKCKVGEICAVDFDLWTGAQDGDIQKPISFHLASTNDNRAVVTMRYTFALDRSRRKAQSAKILVERETQNECWVVADVVSPDGISTVRIIEEFRAKYGRQL